ncbi:uncharacterized protein [Panulirus ornatus]|uniref:uncharacterized protein n=1 Tax=Panulirus ornatus TaxID=150431 RepID=UPI003A86C4F7
MPFPPRRGRIDKRYVENSVKQSLSRPGPGHSLAHREEFDTQLSARRIPHYEEDPFWKSRQESSSYRDSHLNKSHWENRQDVPNYREPHMNMGYQENRQDIVGYRDHLIGTGYLENRQDDPGYRDLHTNAGYRENRQDGSSYRNPHSNLGYQDYQGSRREQECAPPSNPRGNWGRNRKARQGGRGAQGRKVVQAEPPLVLSGIPHLERSFVMNKGSRAGDATWEKEAAQEREVERVHSAGADMSNISGEDRKEVGRLGWEGKTVGDRHENAHNNLTAVTVPQYTNSGECTEAVNYQQEVPSGHNPTYVESVSSNKLSNDSNHDPKQMNDSLSSDTQEASRCYNDKQQNNKKPDEGNCSGQPGLAQSQTSASADPAELELETERYYGELLGKEESDKKVAEKLSASQVAKITVGYKTCEEQKKEEEERIKEEEQKEKERQVQVETAWSVLHQYWQFVRENPYDFNGWTYLLNHVESMDNLEAARSAFDGFLPLYPYCFAYWKKLSDMELKHNEIERYMGVLLIGTECVPFCTELWLPLLSSFITYAKQKNISPKLVQELYKNGLDIVGGSWHSSSLWEFCIDYEQSQGNLVTAMALYRTLLNTPTKLFNKHWDHFLALVRDHHPRNLLSVEDYQALRKQACEELKINYTPTCLMPPKSVQKTPQPEDKLTSHLKEKLVASYIKTHEKNEEEVDKRWKFEEKIKRPYFHVKPLDKKQIKNWNDYLDFEISEGNPVRIIHLFERCLVACALYEDFWCRYGFYMEKHVQNVVDGKFKDSANEEYPNDNENRKDCEDVKVEKSLSDSAENENTVNTEAGKEEKDQNGLDFDEQVIDENIADVKDVKDDNDSVVWGSEAKVGNDLIRDSDDKMQEKNDCSVVNELASSDSLEQLQTKERNDEKNIGATEIKQGENQGQDAYSSEPQTLEELKSELFGNLSLNGRVLKCPPLTPQWIMSGVSWEDVRHIFRRGSWIHCPSKPGLLMQWAEFEETQGNLDTSRELLNTVIAKYPTLLKARMQLIELERRAECYERVEELYAEASRALTQPRHRSWLAIRYARFLFKILMEADRALAVLRRALKKDRGNVHLYHHVFDICYQRQPLDCQGVLASVLLALASKELSIHDKYWFAYKRVEFLREHGDIKGLRMAKQELAELKELVDKDAVNRKEENDTKKESDETKKEEDKEKNEPEAESKDGKCSDGNETPAAITTESVTREAVSTDGLPVPLPFPDPQLNQQFPVPYFAADGAITYNPMVGYGYGHSDPNQALPTAQEVVQGGVETEHQQKSREEYHSVPPTWEFEVQTGSYGYGKSEEHRWHQDAGYSQYNELVAKGYPEHLKDKKVDEVKIPFSINIDHLHRRHGDQESGRLPDMSQPPPSMTGGPPPSSLTLPSSVASNLPVPPKFTRPPPFYSMGSPGLLPPGLRAPSGQIDSLPPGDGPPYSLDSQRSFFDSPLEPFNKRRHPDDYSVKDEPPYKMRCLDDIDLSRQYRPEYDNNYTASPGPSAPPTHRAYFGSYSTSFRSYSSFGQKDDDHLREHLDDRRDLPPRLDSPELSRFNESNRYSLRDANNFDTPLPKELDMKEMEGFCINVPEWLVEDGGELCLSDTERGVSVIRFWPNFMTDQGEKVSFCYDFFKIKTGSLNMLHLIILCFLSRLIRYTGNQYNSCFLNLHRNGYDNVGWMEENHRALCDNPSIASVSLGTTRLFEMRRKDGQGFLRFPLFPGSLLLMEGATQEDWQHQFPKEPNVPGERIHMIFRKMYMIEGLTV